MKRIDRYLLDATTEKAEMSPRLRINHNFHDRPDAPVNRLLNALEPGTYIRPHRHLHPPKEEIFLLLRGQVQLFIFDEEGQVVETFRLDPAAGFYGVELEPGTWHSLVALEPGSVIYEIKEGPFTPLQPIDFAPWSPAPENTEEARAYLTELEKQAAAAATIS